MNIKLRCGCFHIPVCTNPEITLGSWFVEIHIYMIVSPCINHFVCMSKNVCASICETNDIDYQQYYKIAFTCVKWYYWIHSRLKSTLLWFNVVVLNFQNKQHLLTAVHTTLCPFVIREDIIANVYWF